MTKCSRLFDSASSYYCSIVVTSAAVNHNWAKVNDRSTIQKTLTGGISYNENTECGWNNGEPGGNLKSGEIR